MENRNIDRLIEIASLLKSKDLSCFDEFYEYTKTKTYNIIYALVRNQTITEDLLQDTYVKFLNNLESLKEDVNPVGYLTTIDQAFKFLIDREVKGTGMNRQEKMDNLKVFQYFDINSNAYRSARLENIQSITIKGVLYNVENDET